MTTFTLGGFKGCLFRYFSIVRIKMKLSSFIFEYDVIQYMITTQQTNVFTKDAIKDMT